MANASAGTGKRTWDGTDREGKRRHYDEGGSRRDDDRRRGWDDRRRGGDADRRRGPERHRHERSRRDERRGSKRDPSPKQAVEEQEEGEILSSPITPEQPKQQSIIDPEPEPEPELQVEPLDPDAARRARQERWRALREKAAGTASGTATRQTPAPTGTPMIVDTMAVDTRHATPAAAVSSTPFDISKTENQTQANGVSAGDYDPRMDDDDGRRLWDAEREIEAAGKVQLVPQSQGLDLNQGTDDQVEEIEEEDEEDIDDMFSMGDTKPKKTVRKVRRVVQQPSAPAQTLDSAADPEGYYTITLGERMDAGRYQVFSVLGKGMFANVVRARAKDGEVAIKIVRCQETMYKAGLKEAQILKKLRDADPEDKKHVVRMEETFEHRGHLCLVFESMSMNLREVVKRFGKDVGLNLKAVRAYTHQLLLALGHLKKVGVVHADVKPDNILVNETKSLLKLCDLGSAFVLPAASNSFAPYLVSRFYRPPEIILGLPYDTAVDVWSAGCTLFEVYTGKIMFPGRGNRGMVGLMMECRGRMGGRMIKAHRARFREGGDDAECYFDEMGLFIEVGIGGDIKKVNVGAPSLGRDVRARVSASSLTNEEVSFVDFLEKCLVLDPGRRMGPKEALAHAFIRG